MGSEMFSRTRNSPVVIVSLVISALIWNVIPAQAQAADCETSIDGWQEPAIVPSYLRWEPILVALAQRDDALARWVNLSKSEMQVASERAATAVARASDLRTNYHSEAAAAGSILMARDDLVVLLPKHVFDRLQTAVSARTWEHSFRLPVRGKKVIVTNLERCQVTVTTKDAAYLMPEWKFWEFYFEARTLGANEHRVSPGKYSEKHLRDLRSHMRMQRESLTYLINVAVEVQAKIAQLRAQSASETEIEAAVMDARTDLIRSLSHGEWLEVKKAVGTIGGGFTFPSGPAR